MKKLLCVVLWVLPAMLFAQSPFDGTWKTNMAESKLSQKPYTFSVSNGMYDCESCVPKINVKADGQDQPVTGRRMTPSRYRSWTRIRFTPPPRRPARQHSTR